ncbi:penicillin acylase family protein [bacterium]|jgi:penicillin G amidase|nr:penicillin acylase family protein [bacterium]
MKIHKIGSHEFRLGRDSNGVVQIEAPDSNTFAAAMGFVHARDRITQLMLVRLAGQGRLCECLKDSEDTYEIDVFMRELGFGSQAREEVHKLSESAREYCESYCEGINYYMNHHSRPLEFLLVGYHPEPWSVADTLITIKLMGYVGLAQAQQDIEKVIIKCLREGVDDLRLKALFEPHLDEMPEDLPEMLRKVKIYRPAIPDQIRFLTSLPKIQASNNWVLSPSKSHTGSVLQCNDPHLEVNRLPPVWFEYCASVGDNFQMGVNMPGVPGLTMGRTNYVSYGFTYGFMDMIDYYIDEIRDKKFRRGDHFESLSAREELIVRKKNPSKTITVYENLHGIVEADPRKELEDGFYLTRAYSGHTAGTVDSLEVLSRVGDSKSAREVQDFVKRVTISANWLIGDREGNIAYQQSGLLPRRVHSGLYPLPGWDSSYDWKGIHDPDQLSYINNPERGYIVTANEDRNQAGKPLSVNMCMASYRADRIRNLIRQKDKLGIDDMKRIQSDLYSLQAERFLSVLRPHIPDNKAGRILSEWNLCYDRNSQGATIFHKVYMDLMGEVFGQTLFGMEAWDKVDSDTSRILDFYFIFDRILLDCPEEHKKLWFGEEGQEIVFARAMHKTLDKFSNQKIPTWGENQQATMTNLFFGGKLPSIFGFDYGPIVIEGCRATVVQGSIYIDNGKKAAFCPCYRFIADLGTNEAHTILAGGHTDRRFSRFYKNEVEAWLNFQYKTLRVD